MDKLLGAEGEEVAAEDGGPLTERLGPPEGYAAELRASAGLPAPGAGAAGRRAAAVALTPLFAGGGLRFPIPELFGSRVLGLLATAAAVVGSVRLGRRGPGGARRRALTLVAGAALGLLGLAMLLQLGNTEVAGGDGTAYITYAQPASGLRSEGTEISNIFAFDAGGKPLRDVHLVDPDSGQSTPVPAPEFRPPPGPLRSP